MASQFYNVTTNNGDAKIANAIATATKLNITHVVFGDGNGSVPTPDKSRTAMVNEVYRVAPSNYYLHPTIANRLIVEAIIPSNIGGFYIREVGLIADTTVLISDGSVAPIFKEASTDGTREYKLKFALNIVDSGIANITLDSSLIYVTQNTIVDNLTTADATKPLSANQGKILQDTKLDKTANAVSATKLQTARTIGGVSFDGTANINLPGVNTVGNQNTTGNAATAAKLQAARTINGVIFDGSANINLPLIGYDQTWQDVTALRTFDTVYTNSTGKPIAINIYAEASGRPFSISNDGLTWIDCAGMGGGADKENVFMIIPANWKYRIVGNVLITYWMELR